jgi:hypothetical protein
VKITAISFGLTRSVYVAKKKRVIRILTETKPGGRPCVKRPYKWQPFTHKMKIEQVSKLHFIQTHFTDRFGGELD